MTITSYEFSVVRLLGVPVRTGFGFSGHSAYRRSGGTLKWGAGFFYLSKKVFSRLIRAGPCFEKPAAKIGPKRRKTAKNREKCRILNVYFTFIHSPASICRILRAFIIIQKSTFCKKLKEKRRNLWEITKTDRMKLKSISGN